MAHSMPPPRTVASGWPSGPIASVADTVAKVTAPKPHGWRMVETKTGPKPVASHRGMMDAAGKVHSPLALHTQANALLGIGKRLRRHKAKEQATVYRVHPSGTRTIARPATVRRPDVDKVAAWEANNARILAAKQERDAIARADAVARNTWTNS